MPFLAISLLRKILAGVLGDRSIGWGRRRGDSLLLLVVEFSFAVDSSTEHGDGHTSTVEEINGDIEQEDTEQDSEALLEVTTDSHGKSTSQLVGVE